MSNPKEWTFDPYVRVFRTPEGQACGDSRLLSIGRGAAFRILGLAEERGVSHWEALDLMWKEHQQEGGKP